MCLLINEIIKAPYILQGAFKRITKLKCKDYGVF